MKTTRFLIAWLLILSCAAPAVSAFFAQWDAGAGFAGDAPVEFEQVAPRSLFQGRVYDPRVGRFLSADVVVQFPNDRQSYNRYSYVRNNPLTTTDPSGFAEPVDALVLPRKLVGALLADKRVQGGLQTAGGAAEVAAGVALTTAPEPTMLTKVGGPLLVAHGADNISTGLQKMASGEDTKTMTEQGATEVARVVGAKNPEAVGEFVSHVADAAGGGASAGTFSTRVKVAAPEAAAGDTVAAQTPVAHTANPRSLVSRQGPAEMNNSQVKRLTSDMKQNGFDSEKPIEVANVDGKNIIIDGHHRTEAAKRAGIDEVPIVTTEVSEEQAAKLAQEAAEAAAERARLRH